MVSESVNLLNISGNGYLDYCLIEAPYNGYVTIYVDSVKIIESAFYSNSYLCSGFCNSNLCVYYAANNSMYTLPVGNGNVWGVSPVVKSNPYDFSQIQQRNLITPRPLYFKNSLVISITNSYGSTNAAQYTYKGVTY